MRVKLDAFWQDLTHDGLLYEPQDASETGKTMDLIHALMRDLHAAGMESSQEELLKTWHPDMIWFGPAGIGTTYTHCALS